MWFDQSVFRKGQTNNNQTLTDKPRDTAIRADVVGIPECDEVMALRTAETNEKTSYGDCIDARKLLI